MSYRNFSKLFSVAPIVIALLLLLAISVRAQSTDQDLPTPVRSYEIAATIPALDVGDPRLTHHFYAFNGTHGDLLVTVESSNLNGDIDIFTAVNLRPLMKIPMYAQTTASTTTKSIYMRSEEILVLRVEARSPNDDAGRYRIRFGGAFVPFRGGIPVAENEEAGAENLPARANRNGTRRVSSVGARVEEPVIESPPPTVTTTTPPAQPAKSRSETASTSASPKTRSTPPSRSRQPARPRTMLPKEKTASGDKPASSNAGPKREPEAKPAPTPASSEPETRTSPANKQETAQPGAHLIIEQKDGTRIDRPMATVRRILIDNGQIVVFLKNGRIERVSMSEVARMAIEP